MADNHSTQTQAPSNVVIVTGGGNGAFAQIYQQQLASGAIFGVSFADVSMNSVYIVSSPKGNKMNALV